MLRQPDSTNRLQAAGFSYEDACALRRISMTLHRWHELECNGDIERGEATGRPYASWSDHRGHRRQSDTPIPDREAGAKRRLAAIMARYPGHSAYIQTDPRGCALYILTPEMLARYPADQDLSTIYSSGIAVYK